MNHGPWQVHHPSNQPITSEEKEQPTAPSSREPLGQTGRSLDNESCFLQFTDHLRRDGDPVGRPPRRPEGTPVSRPWSPGGYVRNVGDLTLRHLHLAGVTVTTVGGEIDIVTAPRLEDLVRQVRRPGDQVVFD